MSVDFFDCVICGESVCECGNFTCCQNCENKFCTNCYPDPPEWEDGEDFGKYLKRCMKVCPICSEDIILDEDLVKFLLKKLKLTRKQAEKLYKKKG